MANKHGRLVECCTLELLELAAAGDLDGCDRLVYTPGAGKMTEGQIAADTSYDKPYRSPLWASLADHWSCFTGAVLGACASHCAAAAGHVHVLAVLLEREAAPTRAARIPTYANPLHFAALNGRVSCVELLLHAAGPLDAGVVDQAVLDHFGRHGPTALALAACCADEPGGLACAKALLAAGADVNRPGAGGMTALHHAARCGHSSVCELLVAAGAWVAQCSDDGLAALDLGRRLRVESPDAATAAAVVRALRWLPPIRLLWLGHLQAGPADSRARPEEEDGAVGDEAESQPQGPLLSRLTPDLLRIICDHLVRSSRSDSTVVYPLHPDAPLQRAPRSLEIYNGSATLSRSLAAYGPSW